MDLDGAVTALALVIKQTLSPESTARKNAEATLKTYEANEHYAAILLHAIHGKAVIDAEMNDALKLQCAITFKNFIKHHWDESDGSQSLITEQARLIIKSQIVDIMISVPVRLQKQISEAIAIIGAADFPNKWPQLVPYMIGKFEANDFHVINGVLQSAHPLFARYRVAMKSDELWTEIKYVLDEVAPPLTRIFTGIVELIQGGTVTDVPTMKTLFHSLGLISKIFHSLNFQDLPEFFEDNMKIWFQGFQYLLSLPPVPQLVSDDDEKPGVVDTLKVEIVECVSLYTKKYDEEFQPYVGVFVEATWHLLTQTGQEVKYDTLISTAMKFLAHVSTRPAFKDFFKDPATLKALCEQVVVANVYVRPVDEETFEDDVDEYIRLDIEGSDVDTRRRGATDLVRGLCTYYEESVIAIFTGYITTLLAQYHSNPVENWRAKDAATFLITSVVVKGEVQGKGATSTSSKIDVMQYFSNLILPDLQSEDINSAPILKAGALKFLMTFRNSLSREQLVHMIPIVSRFLTAENQVVCSYAAVCIERCLMMKAPTTNTPLITEAEVAAFAEVLLTNLFGAMDRECNTENEYLMKAILRTLSCGKASLAKFMPFIVQKLAHKMLQIAKNPGRPRFNHFMFETASCAIKHGVGETPVLLFEENLFPVMQFMLQHEIDEFQPYVFQLMAQMLEVHPPNDVTGPYRQLFPILLNPALWENLANSPAIVRLLQAYIANGGEAFVMEMSNVEAVLGVFKKLISTKAYDHEGFKLLTTVVENFNVASLKLYIPKVFLDCFHRLKDARLKTLKFMRSMLYFTCVLVGKYGGSFAIAQVDSIQPQCWKMLMNRLLSDVDAIVDDIERKAVIVGLTKLLTETPEMHNEYADMWPLMISSLVKFIEMESDGVEDEENQLANLEKKGYQVTFVKLAFGGHREHDPFTQITNPQNYLATQLANVEKQMPGQLAKRIPPESMAHIQKYFKNAGLS